MKIYVARQPIYELENRVFGYELLYRDGKHSKLEFNNVDGDRATCTVISDALTSFGIEHITNDSIAFINFTQNLLESTIPELLDPKHVIIEILENVVSNDSFVKTIEMWRAKGYIFALDDYIGEEMFDNILPLVDIVKVDFLFIETEKRKDIASKLLSLGKRILAEKVETEQDYKEALEFGYTLFQGYYFNRPLVLTSDLPEVHNSTCLRAFNEISRLEVDFQELENIIKNDVSLSYKLLKHVGTSFYYRGNAICTVKEALVRMGLKSVRNWISLIFISNMSSDDEDNSEQIKIALVRGMFAECTATNMGLKSRRNSAFMTGIFSMLTAMVGRSLSDLLKSVSLPDDVSLALLEHTGILYEILKFVINYQNGDWGIAIEFIEDSGMNPEVVKQDYFECIQYADNIFGYNSVV